MIRATASLVVALALAGAISAPPAFPEEDVKSLPTLLIRGEVVALDVPDSDGTRMSVKDRYGFETPIFVTGQTKFFEGEQEVAKDRLQTEAEVEVEYNFDINTAKRYAVVVTLPVPTEPPAPTSKLVPVAEIPSSEDAAKAPAAADAPEAMGPGGAESVE